MAAALGLRQRPRAFSSLSCLLPPWGLYFSSNATKECHLKPAIPEQSLTTFAALHSIGPATPTDLHQGCGCSSPSYMYFSKLCTASLWCFTRFLRPSKHRKKAAYVCVIWRKAEGLVWPAIAFHRAGPGAPYQQREEQTVEGHLGRMGWQSAGQQSWLGLALWHCGTVMAGCGTMPEVALLNHNVGTSSTGSEVEAQILTFD